MNAQEALQQLEALGTPQNRKVYQRHGVSENLYGVSRADLGKLKKKIKVDHPLAQKLWATGNYDARSLATMIANPELMTEETVDTWAKDLGDHLVADAFAGLVSQTPLARPKMELWTQSEEEWLGRAGWQLLAHLAMKDETLSDDDFTAYLEMIEREIHRRKNRVRDAMNSALIAIGIRNEALEEKALAVAGQIGKVVVDHGETNCKTPDATAYIRKTVERKLKV
jgi:3-methyladenine DNA glycosylase AlkD